MIIIAYNYKGFPVSILSAKSKELATVYLQGADINYHTIKILEEDFTPLSEHPTGVFPILKTREKKVDPHGFNQDTYTIVDK